MKYNSFPIFVLLVFTQVFFSCHSVKPASAVRSATEQKEQAINTCDQIIKYVSTSGKEIKSQQETFKSAEIIINPADKLITLNLESLGNEKGTIKANIISADCQLEKGLTAGYANYRILEIKEGQVGNNLELSFKVEANNDGVMISFKNDAQDFEVIIKVDSWDVVK